MKYITIVGSRHTPLEECEAITQIAKGFALAGYILRSGGAEGADLAGEKGYNLVNCYDQKEIYLPWPGFNGDMSPLNTVCSKALEIAKNIHPNWSVLSQGAQKLHGRNVYQVLGKDLKSPSDLLICWTKNGESVGGTRTAIELAKKYGVPIINLGK